MPNDGDNHEIQNEVGAIPTSSPINTDKFIEALDNVQTNQKRLDTKVDNISAEVSKLDSFITSYVVENGVIVRDIDSLKSELSQHSTKIDELSGSLTNVFNKDNKDNKDKKEKSKEKEDKNSESKEKEESEEKEEKPSNKNILKRVKLSIDNALKKTSSKSLFSTSSLVRITSFSKQGKEELIEGLKQVFTIKKKENSKLNFKTPLIVLTILALIGVFTFLAIKIAAIKKDFEDTVASVKTNKESFITHLTDNLFKTTDSSNNKSLVNIVSEAIEKANLDQVGKNLQNDIKPLNDAAKQAKDNSDVYTKLLESLKNYSGDSISSTVDERIKTLDELYSNFKNNFSENNYKKFLDQLNNVLPNGGNFIINNSNTTSDYTENVPNDKNYYSVEHDSSDGGSNNNPDSIPSPIGRNESGNNHGINSDTQDKTQNNTQNNTQTTTNNSTSTLNDNNKSTIPNKATLSLKKGGKETKTNINKDDTVVIVNENNGILKKYLDSISTNASNFKDFLKADLDTLNGYLSSQIEKNENAIEALKQLNNAIGNIQKCKFEIQHTKSKIGSTGNKIFSSTSNVQLIPTASTASTVRGENSYTLNA